MIKRQLMATVSCLALTGVASAADLPVKAPPPAPVVTQIWAGPYIGINGGAVWHRMAVDTVQNFIAGPAPYDSAKVTATGATFGGQIGYNFVSQNFLYGLEADLNWVGARDSHTQTPFAIPITYTTKLSWLATVRARGGVTFGPNLLYLTGGLAVGGVKNSWAFPPVYICAGVVGCEVANHKTKVGWTAGAGIERFISNNLTAKAEVLYVDLGRSTAARADGDYTSRFKNTAVVGRLGLNLKW